MAKPRVSGAFSWASSVGAIALATLFDREAFLGRAGRAAHHDAVGLDHLGRLRVPVLVVLQAAARIALDRERVGIALLLVRAMLLAALAPPSEHGSVLPARRYTKPPPRRIRLVA